MANHRARANTDFFDTQRNAHRVFRTGGKLTTSTHLGTSPGFPISLRMSRLSGWIQVTI